MEHLHVLSPSNQYTLESLLKIWVLASQESLARISHLGLNVVFNVLRVALQSNYRTLREVFGQFNVHSAREEKQNVVSWRCSSELLESLQKYPVVRAFVKSTDDDSHLGACGIRIRMWATHCSTSGLPEPEVPFAVA
jgi:hypothetical protein